MKPVPHGGVGNGAPLSSGLGGETATTFSVSLLQFAVENRPADAGCPPDLGGRLPGHAERYCHVDVVLLTPRQILKNNPGVFARQFEVDTIQGYIQSVMGRRGVFLLFCQDQP